MPSRWRSFGDNMSILVMIKLKNIRFIYDISHGISDLLMAKPYPSVFLEK
jgi:hypothetical protein